MESSLLQDVGVRPGESGLTPFWQPLFALPQTIASGQPDQTSASARQLLAAAVTLLRPARPSFVIAPVEDAELFTLAQRCVEWKDDADRLQLAGLGGSEAPPSLLADELSFDRYFGISRHVSPDAFAIGIVWGVIATMYELRRPHTLIPPEVAALSSGFSRLAALFLPSLGGQHRFVTEEPVAPVERHPPIDRWRHGHLIFVALTDGLVHAHLRAIEALEQDDLSRCNAAMRDASSLFFASAAALHLTGDFSAEDYDQVRVLMSPPYVPEGFSGLFNADHRQLLRLTRRLSALLQVERAELAWAREEYWQALNDVYGMHRWVCQKLVGGAPSIASSVRHTEQPGHQKLESFARRAMYFGGYLNDACMVRQ